MSTAATVTVGCQPGGLATIILKQSDDAPRFTVSLGRAIKEMQEAADNSAGGKSFDRIALHVALPVNQPRDFADGVLQALCRTDISWNELEITMPKHILKRDDVQDSVYAEEMSQDHEGVRTLVSERFSKTRVVYDGEEQNVPWPWLNATEMGRFNISELWLGGLSVNHFRALAQKTNWDRDGTAVELQVHVDALFQDDTPDGDETEGAAISRIRSLFLGHVQSGVSLQSLLLAGHVNKSITQLKLHASGDMNQLDIFNAIRKCDNLNSAELKCGKGQAAGFKHGCEQKRLVLFESEGKQGQVEVLTVTAYKKMD